VLQKKQKAQGLVEFALILPLFLLLLLGIIEGARIIWAYITVQTAAREAARYAVSGRPYLNTNIPTDQSSTSSTAYKTCVRDPSVVEPDSYNSGAQPWICEKQNRAQAIRKVALERIQTLSVSPSYSCTTVSTFYQSNPKPVTPFKCADYPGAYGVIIRGQENITDTSTYTIYDDSPGTQGLNIEVTTFYNVQMLDPIFNALMGGNFIRLEGQVVLQNEGIDKAAGIVPPPPVSTVDPGSGGGLTCPPTCPTAEIISTNGYSFAQTDEIPVKLTKHPPASYDIYLNNNTGNSYLICTITTTVQETGELSCDLAPHAIPVGSYDFYSVVSGSASPQVALAPSQVTIINANIPSILVDNKSADIILAAKSKASVKLVAHQVISQPFKIDLYDGNGAFVQTLQASTVATTTFTWTVTDMKALGKPLCDVASNKFCSLRSFDKNNNFVTKTDIRINQPQIVLGNGTVFPYAQGQTVEIYLRSHAPNTTYDVKVLDGVPSPYYLNTVTTNDLGDSTFPIFWTIDSNCGAALGWPDGLYDLTSYVAGQTDEIARLDNMQVSTPNTPYIAVSRNTWPSGSLINISVLKHPQLSASGKYYLNFGSNRVPTPDTTDNDTFNTNSCGQAVLAYTIPITLSSGVYQIKSALASNNTVQATKDITVTGVPYILVLEGNKVLPNATINIKLGNHTPNAGFQVIYDDQFVADVLTDNTGQSQFTYDLNTLSPASGPRQFLGTPFELFSANTLDLSTKVATTTLALQGADLQVTSLQVPSSVITTSTLSTTVPVTVTITNLQPVSITSYFDNDLYFNPSPVLPSYLTGYNFPGNAKYWKNSIAANGQPGYTFTITSTLSLQKYGQQTIYGFADTRNAVFEGEQSNQVANPNNLGVLTFTVVCSGARVTDNFDTNITAPNPIPNWALQRFGNANQGFGAQVASQQLQLNSDGSGNLDDNDNTRGEIYFYRTSPVTSTANFDVIVKVVQVPQLAQWSKAGIEVRNSLDPSSPRVLLGLAWNTNTGSPLNRWVLQPAYRSTGSTTDWVGSTTGRSDMIANHNFSTVSSANPVWLRLQRVSGTNQFNFYYAQQASQPLTWGTPVTSVVVSGISDQLYVGLYHSPYRDGTGSSNVGTAIFDNFSYSPGPNSCADNPVQTPANPPGLQICTNPLQNRSFEQGALPYPWNYDFTQGVTVNSGQANTGIRKLLAPSFDGARVNPWFYQKFTMPSWVISSTSQFNLSLYVNVDKLSDGNQPTDKFYVVVATSPSTSTRVTTPTEVAQGVTPGSTYNPTLWQPVNVTLPIINRSTLPSLANQDLYLYFYNDSNSTNACGSGGCRTKFFFDDITLSPCTTEPIPANITSQIKGSITIHNPDGSTEKVGYVKVWAYAEGNNQVYETYTLPSGEFNFYNLPATTTGTKYFIFAQYNYIEPTDPTQIDTLADDTTVTLKPIAVTGEPVQTFLDLYLLPSP
jgi:hypothetical protein